MNPVTVETVEQIKARGAFYTPAEVTAFLANWAIREANERVLEPSCGDGIFMLASSVRYEQLGQPDLAERLYGIELKESEAAKSRGAAPGADIRVGSFFDVTPASLPAMDAVLGNPPYIGYHGFTGDDRRAGLAAAAAQGVKLTKLASSWAHFVVHSISFLPKERGRLALVLPAELLHTDYAEPVRELLTSRFSSVVVIAFDRNIFPDAQVDAVLLLASNDDEAGLRLLRVHDASSLAGLDVSADPTAIRRGPTRRWSATIDADVESIYRELTDSDGVERLGAIGSVDIGVVTGANKFFVLERSEARRNKLPAGVLTPIVARSGDAPGLIVDAVDVKVLLDLRGKPEPTDVGLCAYLALGEKNGVNEGYKCRTRKPWYGVPLPGVKPDAFIPYMNHHAPRLIVNALGAWSTNLIHGLVLADRDRDIYALATAMVSSITLLSAEIEGRAYGGGVLKLETREAEQLLVPKLSAEQEAALLDNFAQIDQLVADDAINEAAALVDSLLDIDHERYMVAYHIFRSRRQERKSKKPKKETT